MLNILSYLGMSMQSEVCLWTLLGLLRTIFDATLFKVNANLKQVWQMTMPRELTLPVQRVLRTMISGVMLVKCFTLYVYLAAYIVLLYPVFLEERPNLVLPWLLLAAVRMLLCELLSLAMGLGVCVLLGPARPPCIRFVVVKFISITPTFYMWTLMYSYYHSLKITSSYKSFSTVDPRETSDFGLELAVRRRRTKSLLDENQLRKRLITNFYNEESIPALATIPSKTVFSSNGSSIPSSDNVDPLSNGQVPNRLLTDFAVEMEGIEFMAPRNADRILEQFILMLLKIGSILNNNEINPDMLMDTPFLPDITKNNYGNDMAVTSPCAESSQNPIDSKEDSTLPTCMKKPSSKERKRVSDCDISLPVIDQMPTLTIMPPTARRSTIPTENLPNENPSPPLNRSSSSRSTGESSVQSIAIVSNRDVRRPLLELVHSTLSTLERSQDCNKTNKNMNNAMNSSPPHGSPLNIVKSIGIIATTITRTTSTTIYPSKRPREQVKEKELEVIKYFEYKNRIATETPSSSSTNTNATRITSYEADL